MTKDDRGKRIEEIKEELKELRHRLSMCSTNDQLEFQITELEDKLEDLKQQEAGE
jgi:chromosome segregation ATPase